MAYFACSCARSVPLPVVPGAGMVHTRCICGLSLSVWIDVVFCASCLSPGYIPRTYNMNSIDVHHCGKCGDYTALELAPLPQPSPLPGVIVGANSLEYAWSTAENAFILIAEGKGLWGRGAMRKALGHPIPVAYDSDPSNPFVVELERARLIEQMAQRAPILDPELLIMTEPWIPF